MHGLWPVEESAELADGPTERSQVARGGCSFALKFSVRRPTVFMEEERRIRPNLTLSFQQ